MTEFVSVRTVDDQRAIATLLLSRPPTNTLTRQMYREIAECAAEVGRRDDVRAVIVFGGHEIFSAGDDLPELRTLNADEMHTVSAVCRAAVGAVAAIPKPTVAALTGYALGGGLTLALAADWRISGDNVKFGATEILDELVPAGGTSRLVDTVGMSKAKDMVLSGRFVDAREALSLRLIDEMVAPDHVYDAALAWAQRFVDHSPQALADAKAAFDL